MILRAVDELAENSNIQITTQITTPKTAQKKTQNQQEILNHLIKHPQSSRKEIAEAISTITENGVKYNLKVLQDSGLLKRIGSARAGHWKVLQ